LLFQIIDNKSECLGYYTDGKLIFEEELPSDMKRTWKYSLSLEEAKGVELAYLYCGGKSIEEVCPSHLRERLQKHSEKLKAFVRSFMESKISLHENCFFNLVPHKFLINYYDAKNEICRHVFENYEKPYNYYYMKDLSMTLEQIRHRPLNVDLKIMRDEAHTVAGKNFINKMKNTKLVCDYNIFGTKTGRLTTKKNTFPILTMDKKYRNILKPTNDWFVELDFNAAELRTILSLNDKEQPTIDMHSWNAEYVYNNDKTRDEAKKSIFAWLYNPDSKDSAPNKFYDKENLLQNYYINGTVTNPFGREIAADPHHAINYLVQSTSADNTLRQMVRIAKMLRGCKSFVAFTLHDSVIIDLHHQERSLLPLLTHSFGSTDLGEFVVNISAGQSFGNMRSL
tara:strand:- start:1536 stop:2723 length:1188 start_codon:yes stop_codon:yes gene_type:complete